MQIEIEMLIFSCLFESVLEHLDPPHKIILQVLLPLSLTLDDVRLKLGKHTSEIEEETMLTQKVKKVPGDPVLKIGCRSLK